MLRGRWMYVVLGAVVVMLYARLFINGPRTLPKLTDPVLTQWGPSRQHVELELEPAELLEAARQKPRLALVLGLLTSLVIGLGIAGFGLSARAVWKRKLRELFRYRSMLPRVWSFGDLARLLALLLMAASLLPFVHIALIAWGPLSIDDAPLGGVISMFILHGLLLLLVWGLASTKALSLARALGLSVSQAAPAMRKGLVGYVSVFPWIFGLLWAIATLCQQLGIEPPIEPIQQLLFMEQRTLVVGLTVVLACVVGPVAEEIFFRGLLFSVMRTRTSRPVAMLISGALFAAVHTNPIGFLPILLLGCLLADLYERTGSLLAPIAVHVFHNSLLVGLGLTLKGLLAG